MKKCDKKPKNFYFGDFGTFFQTPEIENLQFVAKSTLYLYMAYEENIQ